MRGEGESEGEDERCELEIGLRLGEEGEVEGEDDG